MFFKEKKNILRPFFALCFLNVKYARKEKRNDFVTVTIFCDSDNRALLVYRPQPYLLK